MADWYMAWAADHCHKFGFRDGDSQMVLAWREVFELLGFTRDDLRDATGLLLANPNAPRFAADHRGAVIRAVETVRKRRFAKAEAAGPPSCDCCGGVGQVIVPHPGLDDFGAWLMLLRLPAQDPRGVTRTAAVTCTACEKGRRARESTEATGRPQMTLSQYEHHYPYWREVQFEREQVLNARRTPPTPEEVGELNRMLADARKAAAQRASQPRVA